MRIVPGKAQLELHPLAWSQPSAEAATAILRALWRAHPCILAVKLDYNDPPITVDVGIPADGSLDLTALQHQLQEAVQQATVPFRRSCERCGAMNLGGCDCAAGQPPVLRDAESFDQIEASLRRPPRPTAALRALVSSK